jgi:hypothetical protein
VRNVILALGDLKSAGDEGQLRARRAVEALARAMGIVPSSEKVSPPKRPIKSSMAVDEEILGLLNDERKLKELQRYVSRKLKIVQKNIAASQKRKEEEGQGERDENTESTEIILAGGTPASGKKEDSSHPPDEECKNAMGDNSFESDVEHGKTDLVFDNTYRVIKGKKIYDPKTGRTATMDLSLVGPPGKQITWRALVNIMVLVFGLAMPAARIEKLFGKKGFGRNNISDYCAYIAERLLPVYIAMAEAIATCPVVMGDDCVSRVSDITRYRRDLRNWKTLRKKADNKKQFEEENPVPEAPWVKLGPESLTGQLQAELDFDFAHNKLNGDKGPKTRLHTSLLSGELENGNPKSRIVIYRSHLGSVGNLLSRVLLGRKTSHGPLTFVGDLSSSNRISDPEVQKRIQVTYAGCASHARRPFKRHFDHDPEDCEVALDLFRSLFHLEDIMKGTSKKFKAETRADNSMWSWNELKSLCIEMQEKWSPATALGEGIQYVLGNFEQLTLYCRDLRLPVSNDLSERLLRYEKLMDRSSFGRETIEGRARYDIIRSYWQTCVSAGVDPTFALLEVLVTPQKTVLKNPENYIPQSIVQRHAANPERVDLLNRILHAKDFSSLIKYKIHDPNMPLDEDHA